MSRAARTPLRISIRYAPLIITLALHALFFMMFLANVGVGYPTRNRPELIAFLLVVEAALVFGFRIGSAQRPYKARGVGLQVPRWGLRLAAILFVPTIAVYTGGSLGTLTDALLHPGTAYAESAAAISGDRGERLWLIIPKVIAGPLIAATLPVFAYYYFRWRRFGKHLFVSSTLMILTSVFRGTDKELFDVFVIVGAVWFLVRCVRSLQDGSRTVNLFTRRSGAIFLLVLVLLVAVFGFRRSERLSTVDQACFANTNICQPVEHDNPLGTGVSFFARYVTQGFYGLSVAMDARLEMSGTGVGHSRPLEYLAESTLGVSSDDGVVHQLDDLGWTRLGAWSTGYVWIANDVTMYGVPFVIFALGLLFGASWRQVLESPDLASLIVFTYLFYTFIYIIGNLQLAQVGDLYPGVLWWTAAFVLLKSRAPGRAPVYSGGSVR